MNKRQLDSMEALEVDVEGSYVVMRQNHEPAGESSSIYIAIDRLSAVIEILRKTQMEILQDPVLGKVLDLRAAEG